MPKYKVNASQIGYGNHCIVVDAKNQGDAVVKAYVKIMTKKRKWPISKQKNFKKTNSPPSWIFIQETKACSYNKAMEIAKKLQEKDKGYMYRIWDCR